ncbi:MAG: hypothetical protein A3J69_01525 [Candidatus Levybacteria bacterium RIFCSPHIGHO2_02_FULL_42_12]|nr:MAG: hypothetical protein A3J69_01525 [Candidatus Levybacteria bacterium RIFCSPHIGHO2_02_FULL_42_12]
MGTKKKIEYWLDTAHYDLVSAKAMLEAKRFLYAAKKIVEIARLYAQKVASHMPVKMVILYGSYARDTAKKSSDIDVAVVVDKFQGDYLKVQVLLV